MGVQSTFGVGSSSVQLVCGVPHSSVQGRILFIMYTADLVVLIDKRGFCPHLYGDDMLHSSSRHSAEYKSRCSVLNPLQWSDC